MSGWIININGKRPRNWQLAKKHSVWATSRRFPISAGDDLSFWETSSAGLIAREDARPVSEAEACPSPTKLNVITRAVRSRQNLADRNRRYSVLAGPTGTGGGFSSVPSSSVLRLKDASNVFEPSYSGTARPRSHPAASGRSNTSARQSPRISTHAKSSNARLHPLSPNSGAQHRSPSTRDPQL
jgi:hypothetical protein